jgi:hypothetical protein
MMHSFKFPPVRQQLATGSLRSSGLSSVDDHSTLRPSRSSSLRANPAAPHQTQDAALVTILLKLKAAASVASAITLGGEQADDEVVHSPPDTIEAGVQSLMALQTQLRVAADLIDVLVPMMELSAAVPKQS